MTARFGSRRLTQTMFASALFVAMWALVSADPVPVRAATFTVNSTDTSLDFNPGNGICETSPGSGICTLRAAVLEANALAGADVINIGLAGTYVIGGSPGEDAAADGDLDITGPVDITNTSGGIVRIQGSVHDRVFEVRPGAGSVSISGVTIESGTARTVLGVFLAPGGGIWNQGSLTLNNVTLSGNQASAGGGIFSQGPLTINDSTIMNNGPDGVQALGPLTVINRSTISGHTAGGLIVSGETFVTDSSVRGNSASFGGGIANSGFLTISRSTITGNTATFTGGGIRNTDRTLTLIDSTVSDNHAGVSGGGVINALGGPVTVRGSTISENSSNGDGGGFLANGGTLTLSNSTISGNSALGRGGGIYTSNDPVLINHSTLAGNSATIDGAGVFVAHGRVSFSHTIIASAGVNCASDAIGGIQSLGHNISSDASCAFGAVGDRNSTGPMLGALADNGGPTMTHSLLLDSPAIDAGSDTGAPATDQRGVARPQDGDANGTATVDVGAYELERPEPEVINGALRFDGRATSYNRTPQPGAPAGVYTITATFTNTSGESFFDIFFEVTTLTGGNVLHNRDGAPASVPAGVGARLSIPNASLAGGNGRLDPGESLAVAFQIGLATAAPFQFFVDAWGAAVP